MSARATPTYVIKHDVRISYSSKANHCMPAALFLLNLSRTPSAAPARRAAAGCRFCLCASCFFYRPCPCLWELYRLLLPTGFLWLRPPFNSLSHGKMVKAKRKQLCANCKADFCTSQVQLSGIVSLWRPSTNRVPRCSSGRLLQSLLLDRPRLSQRQWIGWHTGCRDERLRYTV
jgi:hypothetical protein